MQAYDTGNDENAFRDLTQEEVDCLQDLAEGSAAPGQARNGSADSRDVDGLLESAQNKLGARNRLHAVSIALRRGIVRGLTDKT
ncbi:helix-turn-helix transcriptional regulator [Rhizobium halophytocola]|uniref:DNA-binding NarL/FixJ family response regulator n=1 Tax=Rhizobium halophytocola TaxID=735519 RepID=A0ABS4E131_9HYPH|nr:helix-turn-helix transcriptional regulator [Rhizobium halophytocola]MBP1851638.1 DNA-binding NarL/FixJ family response regulator [Rhizobium halophytocola]